jgi:hypothetical protein
VFATIRAPIARTLASLCSRERRAAADHDPALGAAVDDLARHVGANGRVISRCIAMSAAIVHGVSEPLERRYELLLQRETCMIRADGDAHTMGLYRDPRGEFAEGSCGDRCEFARSAWRQTQRLSSA